MAGHVSERGPCKRSSEMTDPHRAHTRVSYSPPRANAGPRTIPSLHIADNIVSTEPRYIPSPTSFNHDDSDSENYIYGSSREPWQTSIQQQDDIVRRVSSLALSNGSRTHDKETRSYAEVVKTSRYQDGRSFASRAATGVQTRISREPGGVRSHGHASGPGSWSKSVQPAIGNAVGLRQVKQSVTGGLGETTIHHQRAVKPVYRSLTEGTNLSGTPRTVHRSRSESALHDGLLLKIGYWADERLQNLPEDQSLSLKSLEAVVQCPSGSSSSSRAQQSARSPNESRGGGQGGRAGRGGGKRTPGDRDFHNNMGGGDGNENDPKRSRSDPPQSPQFQKWFACHFHKHDPAYFSTNEATRMRYKTCGARGWTDICRLKEHLYRVHKDRPKCDRCQKEFKKLEQVKAHVREQTGGACEYQPEIPSKGISPEIVAELHKRPKHTMTDEERWKTIWYLLFPNEELPESPYSDVHEAHEIETFLGYLEQEMPNYLITKLHASLGQVNIPEDVKKQVMEIVLCQEKSSRHELWDLYQHGATAEGQVSEGSEKYSSTGSMAMASDHGASELKQTSKDLYQQPQVNNEAITISPATNNFPSHFHQPLRPPSLQPATPSMRSHLPRPSTPVRQMSWNTYDSAIGSDLQSSVNSDARYVDPANLIATPKSHIPHSRTHTLSPAVEMNTNSEISNGYQDNTLLPPSYLCSPPPGPFDLRRVSNQYSNEDEDVLYYPNYTFS